MLQKFALVFGILYLVVGLLGFVPGVVQPPPADAPPLMVEANHGRLLGLFPINLLHNLVHLLVGIWGFLPNAPKRDSWGLSSSVNWRAVQLSLRILVEGADPHASNALSGHGKRFKVSGRSLWPLAV